MIQKGQTWKAGKQYLKITKIKYGVIHFKVVGGSFLDWDMSISLDEFQNMIREKDVVVFDMFAAIQK